MSEHTPGLWEVDAVRNEGEYGNGGPDSHIGFESFAIIDEQGRVLFDTLNRDGTLTEVDEESDDEDGYHRAWDRRGQADAEHAVRCVNAHDELLAVARKVVRMRSGGGTDGFTYDLDVLDEAIRAAEAAIAKATGSAS